MSSKIVSAIPEVPITQQRAVPQHSGKLNNPGVPRATATASFKYGEGKETNQRQTVLQQHVSFFDRDGDGVITATDTFIGFRRLGFNLLVSVLAVIVIHSSLAYVSNPSWLPDPFLRIYVGNVHKCKHGSDSEAYDTEGRFVPQKFEEIVSKYGRDHKDGLSWNGIMCMLYGNMNVFDFFGCISAFIEWSFLYLLAAKNGVVSYEDILAQYDGSLFYRIARERERERERESDARKYDEPELVSKQADANRDFGGRNNAYEESDVYEERETAEESLSSE